MQRGTIWIKGLAAVYTAKPITSICDARNDVFGVIPVIFPDSAMQSVVLV